MGIFNKSLAIAYRSVIRRSVWNQLRATNFLLIFKFKFDDYLDVSCDLLV